MTSLQLVTQYYDCFNRKDWAGMLALLSPQVRHDANQGDSYTGLEHFRQFLQHMDECYDEALTDMFV
ncbi:MAG TPA: nuclear transport factor 2 family protein, partial [Saprospiraceae bacterium]|nr:nuclear transport factor 2 family protein [Saprospiraceae bacterium]